MASRAEQAARGGPPNKNDGASDSQARHRTGPASIKPPRWLKAAVFIAACLPLAFIVASLASDLLRDTRYLGSNPIKEIEHFTGKWALRFLMFTLAITPLMRLSKWGWLVRYRRTFGLFAFFYACVHLLTYAVLDVELSWAEMFEDVLERKYITIGMTAFILLLPLAITSTKGWIKRLGAARWNGLHRLVYAVVVLGTIHFFMAVKKDIREPLVFAGIFAVLLGWRIFMWQRARVAARTMPDVPPSPLVADR